MHGCLPTATMDSIEQRLLQDLDANGEIADTGDWAAKVAVEHGAVVGPIKSLIAHEMIVAKVFIVNNCARRRTGHESSLAGC